MAVLYFEWAAGFVPKGWDVVSEAPDITLASRFELVTIGPVGLKSFLPSMLILAVPHWCFVGGMGILALVLWIPWLPCRFSLRILLIAITLVAVGLGLVVWGRSVNPFLLSAWGGRRMAGAMSAPLPRPPVMTLLAQLGMGGIGGFPEWLVYVYLAVALVLALVVLLIPLAIIHFAITLWQKRWPKPPRPPGPPGPIVPAPPE